MLRECQIWPKNSSFRPEPERQRFPQLCHSDRSRSDSDGGVEEPAVSYLSTAP